MMQHLLNNKALAGFLSAIIGAIGFSFSIVLARMSYDYGTDPQSVLLVRFILLGLIMAGWNVISGISMRVTPRLLLANLAVSAIYFIGIGSYLTSVTYLPVSLAVLLFYTYPIVVAILGAMLDRRWPHPLEIIALIFGFTGLLIALEINVATIPAMGLLFGIMASLGVALNMLASGYLLKNIPTTVFSVYMSISTSALAAIAVITLGDGIALPNAPAGWWIFICMLVTFIGGFLAIYKGIQLIGSLRTSTIMNLEPIATTLVAVVLLHEILTQRHILGGLIVLAAILLAQWPQLRQNK